MPTASELRLEKMQARRVSVGVEIHIRRCRHHLTQADLADLLGWSRTTIVAIEAGKQSVTVDQLWEIADVLHTDVTEFLLWDERIEATRLAMEKATSPATASSSTRPATSARSSSSSTPRPSAPKVRKRLTRRPL